MEPMVAHGVLAIEMEACALYTLAASYGRKALAICTVSDHIVTGEETTSEEREQTFGAMVDIALSRGGSPPAELGQPALAPAGATNSEVWEGTGGALDAGHPDGRRRPPGVRRTGRHCSRGWRHRDRRC